jgi:UrcA family protein
MTSTRSLFPSRAGAAVAAAAAVAITAFGIGSGIGTESSAATAPSVKVAYAGLDLSRPVGAQLLYRRLQQASQGVCGRLDPIDTAAYLRWQHCYDGALQRAVLQVNAPQLLALYHSDASHAPSAG